MANLRKSSKQSQKGLLSIPSGLRQTLIRWRLSQLDNPQSKLTIVRGAFSALLAPGLLRDLGQDPTLSTKVEVESAEQMAILHPDTSKIPIWRRPATRLEHPITAWRCWGLRLEENGWFISSVAADCLWEGPVIRAHKRPVDPKYWDVKKKPDALEARDKTTYAQDSREYYNEMHDTFSIAGIHALKTREQSIEAASAYGVSCYGEVALWGRVAQFELGYRAEVCMVKRLFLTDWHLQHTSEIDVKQLVSDLYRRYGCEVTVD